MSECEICGDDFASDHGVDVHKARTHDTPLNNEEKLRELYVDEELSGHEIAEKIDVAPTNVYQRLDSYGIERRSRSEAQGGPDFTEEELRELYHEEDLYATEIAERVGIDHSCVIRWLQRYDIDLKDISGETHPDWSGGDVDVECAVCGTALTRDRGAYNSSERFFCGEDCRGQWVSENLSGEDSPQYDRIELTCVVCGDDFETWPFKSGRDYCSRDCASEGMVGENNPNYKGSHGDYCGANWQEQREKRLARDGYCCVVCGVKDSEHSETYGEGLHVHHVQPRREFWEGGEFDYESANELSNLVTLCVSCHRKWEGIPLKPQGEPADD